MLETEYKKKIDSYGRITIPSKLREEMMLELGDECQFYKHTAEDGSVYLCIKCGKYESEVERALKLLRESGIVIN